MSVIEKTKVYNVPRYAKDCEYIVVKESEGKYWFWGGYDSIRKALSAAEYIEGDVLNEWEAANGS